MNDKLGKCFVIQPFDNGVYDKRYSDIFKPAILAAGLEPYRVDEDLSVRIPIEQIEEEISKSAICFAEITTDNPNVWYELGYAYACRKDVIMVCSSERKDKFPFDIQHRHITRYETGSTSDFKKLEETITNKITAFRKKSKTIDTLNSTPVIETEGLKSHEIALLILIAQDTLPQDDHVSLYALKSGMKKAGYADIATNVGLRTLLKSQLVESFVGHDEYASGEPYTALSLTSLGEEWILVNQGLFKFRKEKEDESSIDELPF